MNYEPVPYVTVVRLPDDAAEIAANPFSEFQRVHIPAVPSGLVDPTRVLVIGAYDGIQAARGPIDEILVAPSVDRTLCLVIGGEEDPGVAGRVLELPDTLRRRRSLGVLWVGDPRGVLWHLGVSKAHGLTVTPGDPAGHEALATLVDSLRSPEVFDTVFDHAVKLGPVVSPALRVLVPGTAPALLSLAERAAVQGLAGAGNTDIGATPIWSIPEMRPEGFLLGNAPPVTDLFETQGRIGRMVLGVQDAHGEARDATRAIRDRPLSVGATEAQGKVQAAGSRLETLKTSLKTELFERVNGADGLDGSEKSLLKGAGIRTAAIQPPTADLHKYSNHLRELAVAELRRTGSLVAANQGLTNLADQAKPRSTTEAIEELEQRCPDALISRLTNYPPLRLRLGGGMSLTALALLFMAICWVPGWFIAIPIAVVAALAVALVVLSTEATLRAALGEITRDRPQLVAAALAALSGAVVGVAVRLQSDSSALTFAGVLMIPLFSLSWATLIWTRSARAWTREAKLDEVPAAVREMVDLTARVATNDWILANPRLELAQVATRLAAGLENVRGQMLKDLPPAPDAADHDVAVSAKCNPAIRIDLSDARGSSLLRRASEASSIVVADYVEMISASIDDTWPSVFETADAGDATAMGETFRRRLARYRESLQRDGFFRVSAVPLDFGGSPDGDRSARRRLELLSEIWSDSEGVEELLAISPEADLVQFCSAEQLRFLDEDPSRAKVVRFAPARYRRGAGDVVVVQTRSVLLAGVIRLVPLRGGTVEFETDVRVELTASS